MTQESAGEALDDFVVIEGGLVSNRTSVEVFDLDELDWDIHDDTHMGVLHLAQQLDGLTTDGTALPSSLADIPKRLWENCEHMPALLAREVKISGMRLEEGIAELAALLLERGYEVYCYDDDRKAVTWLIVDKGATGNLGIVQHERFRGYATTFPIRPNTVTGSSLHVEDELPTAKTAMHSLDGAIAPTFGNFATRNAPLPNHGWDHFEWMRRKTVRIIAD